jgi:ATP-dependent DNA helicase PIF1
VFKVGAQVMLTYNLSIEDGLVNGSRGIITFISPDSKNITVLFKNGITSVIPYNLYEFEDDHVKVQRHQIPLVLAWGTSIHKSQGSTLDYAIIDLGPNIFSPGMAYVALSRVKSLDGIYISSFLNGKLYADKDALDFEDQMDLLTK